MKTFITALVLCLVCSFAQASTARRDTVPAMDTTGAAQKLIAFNDSLEMAHDSLIKYQQLSQYNRMIGNSSADSAARIKSNAYLLKFTHYSAMIDRIRFKMSMADKKQIQSQ